MQAKLVFLAILASLITTAAAGPPEPKQPAAEGLVIAADRSVASASQAYNPRFMAEHRYFAKRYRIVEINPEVSQMAAKVTIKLFEDSPPVTFIRDSVRAGPNPETTVWQGSVDFPGVDFSEIPIPQEEMEKIDKLGMTPAELLAAVTRVRLFFVNWDMDPKSNTAFLSYPPMDAAAVSDPTVAALRLDIEKRAFVSLNADIDLSVLGRGVYRIRPMTYSPRYHLLYEVDTEKTFEFTDADPKGARESRSAQQYADYMRSLPDDKPKTVRGVMR